MRLKSEATGLGDWRGSSAGQVDDLISRAGLLDLSSLADMIDRVATLHGKPIRLEQVGDDKWGTLTGLWVETPQASRIFTRRTDPAGYQAVCALHELMHILLDHPGCLTGTAGSGAALPLPVRRARDVSVVTEVPKLDGAEFEAERGARILARSLLHGVDDSTERRFG